MTWTADRLFFSRRALVNMWSWYRKNLWKDNLKQLVKNQHVIESKHKQKESTLLSLRKYSKYFIFLTASYSWHKIILKSLLQNYCCSWKTPMQCIRLYYIIFLLLLSLLRMVVNKFILLDLSSLTGLMKWGPFWSTGILL